MPENAFYANKEYGYCMHLEYPEDGNILNANIKKIEPVGHGEIEITTKTIEMPDRCYECQFHVCDEMNGDYGPMCTIYTKAILNGIKPDWCKVEKIVIYEKGDKQCQRLEGISK